MKNMKLRLIKIFSTFLLLSFMLVCLSAVALAQTYPVKPVRLIIPFAPGGVNDIIGRLIAVPLSERLGQHVVVDNRGGAGGVLGTEIAAKSPPDGYTLFMNSAATPISAALYKELPFDPVKSFVPIAKIGIGPNVLISYPGYPVHSVKELITLSKKQPGKLICASIGVGSFSHLATELFKIMAEIDFIIVHFKGGGPATVDVMGGHSQFMLVSLVTAVPHIQSGKLRALGTTGSKRSTALPTVPTIAEAGVPGYEANSWWGIVAPAGTPKPVVDRLNKELSAVLSTAEMKKRFEEQGAEVEYLGSTEFGKFISTEMVKWPRVVKEANIKVE